jgi:CDP-glucose 4,6-dehydratase
MQFPPLGEDYCLTMDFKLGEQLRVLPGPILITGHTGFKGTWLTFLLEHLAVPVIGYSLVPENNSLYCRAERTGKIPELFADIRDETTFQKFLYANKPSAIIHMAAQPLVLQSYKTPRETFDVNVMGTVNVLDAAFLNDFVQVVVIVTTDKVYRNDNSGRAFVETDPLEGKDPYSASKVGTEAAVSAWQQIQKVSGGPRVVSVRAGNVIGGGDWAENRLIPDLVRGYISGKPIEIRNPESTRPWQHVLDPLVGYLMSIEYALSGGAISNINFAPKGSSLTVSEVIEIANKSWNGTSKTEIISQIVSKEFETKNLSLNSSLATELFGEFTTWNQVTSIEKTIKWWNRVAIDGENPSQSTLADVKEFFENISL